MTRIVQEVLEGYVVVTELRIHLGLLLWKVITSPVSSRCLESLTIACWFFWRHPKSKKLFWMSLSGLDLGNAVVTVVVLPQGFTACLRRFGEDPTWSCSFGWRVCLRLLQVCRRESQNLTVSLVRLRVLPKMCRAILQSLKLEGRKWVFILSWLIIVIVKVVPLPVLVLVWTRARCRIRWHCRGDDHFSGWWQWAEVDDHFYLPFQLDASK